MDTSILEHHLPRPLDGSSQLSAESAMAAAGVSEDEELSDDDDWEDSYSGFEELEEEGSPPGMGEQRRLPRALPGGSGQCASTPDPRLRLNSTYAGELKLALDRLRDDYSKLDTLATPSTFNGGGGGSLSQSESRMTFLKKL